MLVEAAATIIIKLDSKTPILRGTNIEFISLSQVLILDRVRGAIRLWLIAGITGP